MRHLDPDVVIVGAGIAGGALGTVLARAGFEVVLLERENSYFDRVRGEYHGALGCDRAREARTLAATARGRCAVYQAQYPLRRESSRRQRLRRAALDLTKMHAEGFGALCLGHPATCDIFAQLATLAHQHQRREPERPTSRYPVVIVCMFGSSKSWGPQQLPLSWCSRAGECCRSGGGAVYNRERSQQRSPLFDPRRGRSRPGGLRGRSSWRLRLITSSYLVGAAPAGRRALRFRMRPI